MGGWLLQTTPQKKSHWKSLPPFQNNTILRLCKKGAQFVWIKSEWANHMTGWTYLSYIFRSGQRHLFFVGLSANILYI